MDVDAESDANHGLSPPPLSVNFTDDDIFGRKTTHHTANENDIFLSNSRPPTVASTILSSVLDGKEKDNINNAGLDWLGIGVRMLSRYRSQFQAKTKSKPK